MTKQDWVNYTDAETQRQAQEQGHVELAVVTFLPQAAPCTVTPAAE